jgi:Zn-dependent M28 family amino/carboxypeptidase
MRVLLAPARLAALLLVALLAVVAVAPAATATSRGRESDTIKYSRNFRQKVEVEDIRKHQAALQSFSDANGGNRVAGGPGYEASAEYVVKLMTKAGYNVTSEYFEFPFNADRTPPIFTSGAVSYVDGVDFSSMTFSPSGDVTAAVTAVDLVVPAPGAGNANTSGCEAADFAGFPAGTIALVQRGTCTFAIKAENAAAAGAAAVIVFNEGQAGRTAVINGTLGGVVAFAAPVIGTTFAAGDALRNGVLNGPTGTTATVRVDRVAETRTTRNIIAESPTGDPNHVVVVGAHLDSVPRGAGVNDNGSGTAALLVIASELADRYDFGDDDDDKDDDDDGPRNKVRFIWWGAEELGLLGSNYHVSQLDQAERDAIELNLNFDMIGSPNYVRFIYDGNNSAFPAAPPAVQLGPAGSGDIEQVFIDYFEAKGLPHKPTPFNGRSDYGPFITVGIPAGGLFTGAEGAKTEEEAAIFGGVAGEQYDRCYHLACDTFTTTGEAFALKGLDEMSDAAAHAVLTFATRNFDKKPLTDPVVAPTTGSNGGGGGLHDEHDHEVVAE